MIEDRKKGQSEVNVLDQKKQSYSEVEELYKTLKSIKLWRTKDSEGPRSHVRFVLFCSWQFSLSRLWVCLLLTTYRNKQRTSRTRRM